jgi:DNA repair protein RecO (recombination protein O)
MPLQEGTAVVLTARPWGEGGVVATLLCPAQGMVRGLVKRAKAAELQPLNQVRYRHSRRLESQLGTLALELERSRASLWLGHPRHALALTAAADLLAALLPESHPYPAVAVVLEHLLASDLGWRAYVGFERVVLEQVGYGLQLHQPVPCPENSELAYVSPTSWRSVPRAVARGYESRLLALPHCWGGPPAPEAADCAAALALTGTLLGRALHGSLAHEPLASRHRLGQAYLAALAPERVPASLAA